MYTLLSGQEAMLSWTEGSVPCRVVAAAGRYVLLRPDRDDPFSLRPAGPCSLTYLDGVVPMGFDGVVEPAAHPGEFRFKLDDRERQSERRAAARAPSDAAVWIRHGEEVVQGRALDVSAGGMRFRHPVRLGGRGEMLRIVCELDGGIRVDADAVICTADVGVCSVRFTALHDADAHAIGGWAVNRLRTELATR